MTTDFTYSNKTINTGGPIKPSGKDMPCDSRTRVETYADIASIPNPYVGMVITVLQDENNGNAMKDYKVKSLKANALGITNSVIDEVVPYADYLGVSSSGGGTVDLSGYVTDEELTTALSNVDAVSLNGKTFSQPMTKAEYDAIAEKDTNTIYLVDDDSAIEGVPDYSTNDANKVLAVNASGTALAWVDVPIGSGNGMTVEQSSQLAIAYAHSQSDHVQAGDIPTAVSQLTNDSNFATESYVTTKIAEASLSGGEVDLSGYATIDQLNTKANISDIPTKTSQLTNDSSFVTTSEMNSAISSIPSGGGSSKRYWLTGKTWLVLGDSITDATVNTKGDKYYKFISDMVGGCTIVNRGFSGITVAGLTTKLDSIDTAGIQVVTALIGVNDWNFPVPLGKEGDTGTDTEYGIIYNFVLKLVTKFPRITILGLIPLPCQASNGVLQGTCSEGFSLKQLTDAIKYTYELFSIPYLDLFNQSGIHATIPSSRDFFYSDGLHPTVNAHKAIANKILSFIENNYFDYNYGTSSSDTNIAVTGVSLSDNSKTVNKNDSFTLTATISPTTATNKTVVFSANNSNVSINQSGLSATITGVAEGSSIVTVTTEDGNKTATCNVTVTAASSGEGGETGGSVEDTMDVVSDGTATFKIGGINIEKGDLIDSTAEARTSHCIPITLGDNNSITISSDLIGQAGGKFMFGMALYDESGNWLESTVGTNPATYWHSTSGAVSTFRKIYVNNATIFPPNNGLKGTPVKMKVSFTCVNNNTVLDLASIQGHTFTINGVTYTIQ